MDNVFSQPINPQPSKLVDGKTIADTVYGKQAFEADKSVPPAAYTELFGKPYAMDALGVGMSFAKAGPNTMSDLKAIDGFILTQMDKNGLENTKESYQEMLDQIYQMLDIGKNTAVSVKIAKLAQLVNTKGLKAVRMK